MTSCQIWSITFLTSSPFSMALGSKTIVLSWCSWQLFSISILSRIFFSFVLVPMLNNFFFSSAVLFSMRHALEGNLVSIMRIYENGPALRLSSDYWNMLDLPVKLLFSNWAAMIQWISLSGVFSSGPSDAPWLHTASPYIGTDQTQVLLGYWWLFSPACILRFVRIVCYLFANIVFSFVNLAAVFFNVGIQRSQTCYISTTISQNPTQLLSEIP